MQVVKITDIAELPVPGDVSIEDVFQWARQQFNLEDDVCAYVPNETGTDVEVLKSNWKTTPAPVESRLLFKPKAKPDGGCGLEGLSYSQLRELAKLHGLPNTGKKADLITALSQAGITPNPSAKAKKITLTGYSRTDGAVVIPLDPAKSATLEFYEQRAEAEVDLISTTSASAFRGLTLGKVISRFGRTLLGLPAGIKKLFAEKGIEYAVTINGEPQKNSFMFEDGEKVHVVRVKHYPTTAYLSARFVAERFVGQMVTDVILGTQFLLDADYNAIGHVVAVYVNDKPCDPEDQYHLQAGDVAKVIYTK